LPRQSKPSAEDVEGDFGTGQVIVAERAIADIVGWTVLECYGVVGMASPNLVRGVARLLTRDKLHQGIRVERDNERLKVDLFIVLEYGLNVAEVAGNVRAQVAYNVEKAVGQPVTDLHIHVQGVKVGET
jgi:uncharacterized alkaline shock family protein YloU